MAALCENLSNTGRLAWDDFPKALPASNPDSLGPTCQTPPHTGRGRVNCPFDS